MTIDQEADADTLSAASEDLDSSIDSGSEDSQTTDTQTTDGDTATSEPDTSASSDDSDGSLTTVDTTLQTTSQEEKDYKAEYEKAMARINDLRSGYTRKASEFDTFRKQYDGVDAAAVRKFREEQERATQANLPVFNAKHPEHAAFKDTLIRFRQYEKAIGRAETPEAKQVVQQTLGADFTEKEGEQIRAWKLHQQRESEAAAMDPEGYRREQYRKEALAVYQEQQEIQQAQMEEQRVTHDVHSWMEDPKNKPLVEKYRERMIDCLSKGYGWAAVKELIPLWEQQGGLQSRVSDAEKQSAIARAQQSALRTKATTTRDPATNKVDPQQAYKKGIEYAKKYNLPYSHINVLNHIEKIVNSASQ